MNEPIAYVTGVRQFDPVMADTVLKVGTALYTHPANLTNEEIDSVIHELRQKSFDPKRWVDVYTIAIETIIQLRNELRKAQE